MSILLIVCLPLNTRTISNVTTTAYITYEASSFTQQLPTSIIQLPTLTIQTSSITLRPVYNRGIVHSNERRILTFLISVSVSKEIQHWRWLILLHIYLPAGRPSSLYISASCQCVPLLSACQYLDYCLGHTISTTTTTTIITMSLQRLVAQPISIINLLLLQYSNRDAAYQSSCDRFVYNFRTP